MEAAWRKRASQPTRRCKRIGDDGEEISEVARGGQMDYNCFGVSKQETDDFFSGSDWDFITSGGEVVGTAQV